MKTIKYALPVLGCAVIICLGIFLPAIVSIIKDRSTVNNIQMIEAQEINIDVKSDITLFDKMVLLGNPAEYLSLETGRYIDSRESACARGIEEAGKLDREGLLKINYGTCNVECSGVNFLMDPEDPSRSIITWDILIIGDNADLSIVLDDETGKIISLNYFDPISDINVYYDEAADKADSNHNETSWDIAKMNILTKELAAYWEVDSYEIIGEEKPSESASGMLEYAIQLEKDGEAITFGLLFELYGNGFYSYSYYNEN